MAKTKPLTAYWMHDVIRISEPLTIGKHAWRLEPVQKRTFVIAHDHGLEAVLDPQERLGRVPDRGRPDRRARRGGRKRGQSEARAVQRSRVRKQPCTSPTTKSRPAMLTPNPTGA